MNALSLFSGIGGIDLACEWAGIQTVAFCEREPFCQKVLNKHWPNVPIYDDVRTLTKERLEQDGIIGPGRTIDLICGGFPCQPYSIAGKRRGKEDDRDLWPEMFRVISEIRPPWVVGENVANFVNMELERTLSDLESISYQTQTFIIPACGVDAKHERYRTFVVANSGCELRKGSVQQRTDGMETEKQYANITERSSETVADSCGAGRKERHASAIADRPGYGAGRGDEGRSNWPTQSGMGGVLDGLSDWLDQFRWPAAMGLEQQYDWEPPRVATGVKNRAARLKALGNAVVPQQIYPILRAIREIHETGKEGVICDQG